MSSFQKATKTQAKLRLALCGPSGSGKTYSALSIAQHLGEAPRVAVIDTEHGSAAKYADRFGFDTAQLVEPFHPGKYINLLREAGAEYDVIVVDSLSHAWYWELDQTSRAENSFRAWGDVRPLERALINTILQSPAHVIATMRTKTEWVLEERTNRKGKVTQAPRKVGTAPVQASNIDYEFDISGELDLNHLFTISKSRCPALANTQHANPGKELAEQLMDWLTDGATLLESGMSKCDRVRVAREAAGMTTGQVREMLQSAFGVETPRELSSEQCDELVARIEAVPAVA